MNITELTALVEQIETGTEVGPGLPSPSTAYSENSAEYRALASRARAAFHRGAGHTDTSAGDLAW